MSAQQDKPVPMSFIIPPWRAIVRHGMTPEAVRAQLARTFRAACLAQALPEIRAMLVEEAGVSPADSTWHASIAFERLLSAWLDITVPQVLASMAKTAAEGGGEIGAEGTRH